MQHSDHEGFTADALGNAYETGRGGINQPWKITRHLYEPGTGRLYRSESVDPHQAYMYFDFIHAYDESGNQHRRGGTRGTNGSIDHISIAQSYYGADQRLRAVDRRVCSVNQYATCRSPSETLFIHDPSVFEEYRYDPLGRRIAVRTRRDHQCLGGGCNGAVLRTVWDGDQVLYEIRAPGGQGATAAQMENDTTTLRGTLAAPFGRILYTHGPGIDQPLSMVRMGYTWGDGSRAAAEPLTGAHEIVLYANWRGTYDRGGMPDGSGRMPFGTDAHGTLSMVASFPGRNLGAFLGQRTGVSWQSWMGGQIDQQRDASGLLYRRNRYYDPASGLFTQEDPIGLAGGLNVYGYANADPANYSDPYGLKADTIIPVDNESSEVLFAVYLAAGLAAESSDPGIAGAGHALLAGLDALHSASETIYFQVSTRHGSFTGPRIGGPGLVVNVNPNQSTKRHIAVRAAHELGHAYGVVINGATDPRNSAHRRQQNQNSLYFENAMRTIFGCVHRLLHGTDSNRQNPGCQP